MNSWVTRALRALPAAAITISLVGAPLAGRTQDATTALPSYAVNAGETIKGTISGFDGANLMYVRDVRGFIDNVTLHPGTVINPVGLRLQPGDAVSITGRSSGKTFIADQIDTPYREYGYDYGDYPYYPYYGYPYYGYPYGYGFGYGYGYPLIGFGIGFGFGFGFDRFGGFGRGFGRGFDRGFSRGGGGFSRGFARGGGRRG